MTHKDRLLRFGAELVFSICESRGVEVVKKSGRGGITVTMILAHRRQLYPNNVQETYFAKACGVASFAYNWGLSEWSRLHKAGEKVSESALRKKLNSIKKDMFLWMSKITKCAPQLSIMNLGGAFKNFFKGTAQYPKFKKKCIHDSFSVSNNQFLIKECEKSKIRIPSLGWVRLAENLRFNGKMTVSAVKQEFNIKHTYRMFE